MLPVFFHFDNIPTFKKVYSLPTILYQIKRFLNLWKKRNNPNVPTKILDQNIVFNFCKEYPYYRNRQTENGGQFQKGEKKEKQRVK